MSFSPVPDAPAYHHYLHAIHTGLTALIDCNAEWTLIERIEKIATGIFALITLIPAYLAYQIKNFVFTPLPSDEARPEDSRRREVPVHQAPVQQDPAHEVLYHSEHRPFQSISYARQIDRVDTPPARNPPPPDLTILSAQLRYTEFGQLEVEARGFEQNLSAGYQGFAEELFEKHLQTHREKQEKWEGGEPKRVLVIGAGPGGLFAALEAYMKGCRVTLVEKRLPTRDQILRLSPGMFQYFFDILGGPFKTHLGTGNFYQHRLQGQGNRKLFDEGDFYSIEIRDLQKAVLIFIEELAKRDPEAFRFISGSEFKEFLPPTTDQETWKVKIHHQGELELPVDIIVGADGGQSALQAICGFSSMATSSTSLYGAATFNQPFGRLEEQTELDDDIPELVYEGAKLSNLLGKDFQLGIMRTARARNYLLAELEILAETIEPTNLALYRRGFQQIEAKEEYELDFVRRGVQRQIESLSVTFGWEFDRLPISRFFTSVSTVYIGCEFPPKLLGQIQEAIRADRLDEAKSLQENWYRAVLKAHLPQSTIDELVVRHGGAFPVQLKKANSCHRELTSAGKSLHSYILGDGFATPHFLTGRGAEFAIDMARDFGEHLSKMRDDKESAEQHLVELNSKSQKRAQELQDKAFDEGMLGRV